MFAFIRDDDGSVSIVIPAKKNNIENIIGRMTDDEYESHIKSSIPNGRLVINVDNDKIPSSREFRNAWKIENGFIKECISKSIEIQLSKIRRQRKYVFEGLDIDYMIALEKQDNIKIKDIIEKKQKLRDATNILKSGKINSVDELRGKNLEDYIK